MMRILWLQAASAGYWLSMKQNIDKSNLQKKEETSLADARMNN